MISHILSGYSASHLHLQERRLGLIKSALSDRKTVHLTYKTSEIPFAYLAYSAVSAFESVPEMRYLRTGLAQRVRYL